MSRREAHAPRGAIPNWQPATTIDAYLRNCREGLEEYSDRRAAGLFGVPRIELQRWKLAAELPEALFEQLLAHGVRSLKAIANVAVAFRQGQNGMEIERCPHCGEVIRERRHIAANARAAIRAWLDEGAP